MTVNLTSSAQESSIPTLVVITATFPFGIGEQFLETELPYLLHRFQNVLIVPRSAVGVARPVPPNARVDTSLAAALSETGLNRLFQLTAAIVSNIGLFLSEIYSNYRILATAVSLKRLLGALRSSYVTKQWAQDFLGGERSDPERTIFYFYWLESQALGAAQAKARYPSVKVIARAHRYDVYEELMPNAYRPLARPLIAGVDEIYVVSNHGSEYLRNRYPWASTKISTSRLGVAEPRSATPFYAPQGGTDKSFTLVLASVSFLTPVKRVHLIIEALSIAGTQRPDIDITWHHLGDGPERAALAQLAAQVLPGNVRHFMHGQVANSDVHKFYATEQVDLLVNVSASEGVPVSIMEAQSYGIPVVATRVGGTPEIVDVDNGLLLSANPSPQEIAAALLQPVESPTAWSRKRISSLNTWHTKCNAGRNYTAFAAQLAMLSARSVTTR